LRSAALTLIAVVLKTTDLESLAHELEQRASVMPGLFDDEPVVIDLSCVHDAEEALNLVDLVALLRRYRMPPVMLTERIVEVKLPALPPMIVERPLRSGQQVYAHDRDLVVLSLVSYGAEVIADGHIHVYAPLRGRAIAGAKGNKEARIFSTAMEAQLLAIAGVYRTTDVALPSTVVGRVAMVRLAGDSLLVEPLQ